MVTDGVGVDATLECVGTGQSMETAFAIARPGSMVGASAPRTTSRCRSTPSSSATSACAAASAPVRAYIPELLDDVLEGRINPGRVFDYETDLDGIGEATPRWTSAVRSRRSCASGRSDAVRASRGVDQGLPAPTREEFSVSESSSSSEQDRSVRRSRGASARQARRAGRPAPGERRAAAEVMGNAGYDVSPRRSTCPRASRFTRSSRQPRARRRHRADPRRRRLAQPGLPCDDPPVDLYGTALVLEEFGNVIARGGAGVVIASQSGHRLTALTAEQNIALATTPPKSCSGCPSSSPTR